MPFFSEIPSFSKDIQWTSLDASVGQLRSKVSDWKNFLSSTMVMKISYRVDGISSPVKVIFHLFFHEHSKYNDNYYDITTTLKFQRVHFYPLIIKKLIGKYGTARRETGRYRCVTDIYACTVLWKILKLLFSV